MLPRNSTKTDRAPGWIRIFPSGAALTLVASYAQSAHGRTHVPGDRCGLVRAVIVNDNHFDGDVSPRSQMLGGTLDGLQSARKIARLIEGGDDYGDVHLRLVFTRRDCYALAHSKARVA